MKPTLGYPSRIAAIVALRRERKTEKQIAELLGIKPNTVTSIEARARQRHSLGDGHLVRIRVPGETLVDLTEHADRLGISPDKLAQQLLKVIARDDLVGAILDEGAPDDQRRTRYPVAP